MSSKKDFCSKQQLKSTKCHDRDYFCDTLDEIMLGREPVEFNSSVEPNNVCEFYLAFMMMQNLMYLQSVFILQCQDFNYNNYALTQIQL